MRNELILGGLVQNSSWEPIGQIFALWRSIFFGLFVFAFSSSLFANDAIKECDSMTLGQLKQEGTYVLGCYETHLQGDQSRSYFIVLENQTAMNQFGKRPGLTLALYRSNQDYTIELPAFRSAPFLATAGIPFSYETPGNTKMFIVTDFEGDGHLEAAFLGNGQDSRISHFFVSRVVVNSPTDISLQFYQPVSNEWSDQPSYFRGLGRGDYILSRSDSQMRLFVPIKRTYLKGGLENVEYAKHYYDLDSNSFVNSPLRSSSMSSMGE